jgi:single-strand DNA-binding protein
VNDLLISLLRASSHTITGRLSADPVPNFLNSGSVVANVSMAVNQPGAKRDDGIPPDWFKVAVWGDQAQAFADSCHKGDLVKVTGRCKTESWTTNAGEKRTQWVITADEWELVRAANSGQQSAPAPTARPAAQQGWTSSAPAAGGFDDSEVPF